MNRRNLVVTTLALTFALTPATHAADKPTPDKTNDVVKYYYSDAAEPVLMEFKLCQGVHTEGPEKHNCTKELDRAKIEAGSEVYLWMKYLVPREATATVLTQLKHKGITRRTFNRELDGALRYRTWHRTSFSNTGKWEVNVLYEAGDAVTKLHSTVLEVQ